MFKLAIVTIVFTLGFAVAIGSSFKGSDVVKGLGQLISAQMQVVK